MHAWLENQIGQSAANIITSFVVLIIVIAAIAVTISLLRKFNKGTFVVGGKSRTPRLSVRDAAAVDRMRRLVLVRRDNVEHLLMIGGPTDLVIETNIKVDKPATTNLESFISPKNNSVQETISEPAYREPVMNEPFAPKNVSVSPTTGAAPGHLVSNATPPLRSDVSVAPMHGDVKEDPTTRPFNRVSPDLDVIVSTDNVNLNRNSSPSSPHNLREPSMENFPAPSADRVTSQHAAISNVAPHFLSPTEDETINAEIEGHREPSLNIPPKSSDPTINLDNEFDHIFENELKDAIKNEKI